MYAVWLFVTSCTMRDADCTRLSPAKAAELPASEKTTVNAMTSHDDGKSWSKPIAIATTTDTSDHPLLVSDGHKTYLSWMTKAEGYRLLAIGDES